MVGWLMNNRLERQDSNQGPPKYKSEVFMLETTLISSGLYQSRRAVCESFLTLSPWRWKQNSYTKCCGLYIKSKDDWKNVSKLSYISTHFTRHKKNQVSCSRPNHQKIYHSYMSLCLINSALWREDIWGSGGIAPPFLTSALDGG
jgi:hypothetical protein